MQFKQGSYILQKYCACTYNIHVRYSNGAKSNSTLFFIIVFFMLHVCFGRQGEDPSPVPDPVIVLDSTFDQNLCSLSSDQSQSLSTNFYLAFNMKCRIVMEISALYLLSAILIQNLNSECRLISQWNKYNNVHDMNITSSYPQCNLLHFIDMKIIVCNSTAVSDDAK